MFRENGDFLEVFLVRPGGPYWSKNTRMARKLLLQRNASFKRRLGLAELGVPRTRFGPSESGKWSSRGRSKVTAILLSSSATAARWNGIPGLEIASSSPRWIAVCNSRLWDAAVFICEKSGLFYGVCRSSSVSSSKSRGRRSVDRVLFELEITEPHADRAVKLLRRQIDSLLQRECDVRKLLTVNDCMRGVRLRVKEPTSWS